MRINKNRGYRYDTRQPLDKHGAVAFRAIQFNT